MKNKIYVDKLKTFKTMVELQPHYTKRTRQLENGA